MEALTLNELILTEKDFRKISQMVYDHCGINLHEGKKELVRARLAKRLRVGNFRTFPEYIDYVLADKTGMEFSILIDSISTNLPASSAKNSISDLWKPNSFQLCLKEKEQHIILKYADGAQDALLARNLIRYR
jgi:hypothetical protein